MSIAVPARTIEPEPAAAAPRPRPACCRTAPPPSEPIRRQVVAMVPAKVRERLSSTILGRPGFTLFSAGSESEVLQRLLKQPPHLFVYYDSGTGSGLGLLDRLLAAYPRPPFPVVVLAEFADDVYPEAVKTVLPVDFEPRRFDHEMARLLGLPSASAGRLLVRLGTRLGDSRAPSILATAFGLRPEGTVLASSRALTVGRTYQVAVLGLPSGTTDLPDLRILREEHAQGGGQRLRSYVAGFVGADQPALERFLHTLLP